MPVQKPPVVRISIPSSSYGIGRRFPLSQISEHHVVGDAIHVINKAKTQQFSTTYTIGTDGTIYQLVDDHNTPFCDNAWQSNGRSITIEHAGGGNYPYTEAMYQASIKLHAWLFQTYGNLNCVKHQHIPEAPATACPGGLDVTRIVNGAKQLLNNSEVDMITPNDVDVLRIAHSEIGGWDVHATHRGEFDQKFLGAWQGRPMAEFIRAQWVGGATYREKRIAEMQAYPQLVESIRQLEARLNEANNKPAHEVIKEVEKIVEKCNTTITETTEPPKPKAPTLLVRFLAWLARRLAKRKA